MKLSILYTDYPLNEGWRETIKDLWKRRKTRKPDSKEESARRALMDAYEQIMAKAYERGNLKPETIENISRRLKFAMTSKAWIKDVKNAVDPEKAALEKMFRRLNHFSRMAKDPNLAYKGLGLDPKWMHNDVDI